nr:MAG TPA: KGK domain [Caudoviricetes sp.]
MSAVWAADLGLRLRILPSLEFCPDVCLLNLPYFLILSFF